MDPARVMDVLDAVLDTTLAERPGVIDALCGDDLELRREIERLLALENDARSFLPASAVRLGAEDTVERLGPYRLLDVIGRGGMGTVYRAVREDDFKKQVALKVLRRELASDDMVRRFHDERQILAHLEHPGIAHILDGGTLPDGRPYLVMEHVEGEPVSDFCSSRGLRLRERLELFRQIASAVAFAHRNLIVHRDIKPGNVLVTTAGVPKLVDFGIAKLLADETPVLEKAASGAMTPRYASPEQVLGERVTTASDVYALGLLLFKMLKGTLPCGLEACPLQDVVGHILRDEPESLGLGADVDVIVAKALRKDPRERYPSAEQLAEDVGRFLSHRPVQARQGSWLYVARKFVRRHPWAATAAVLVVVFSISTTILWREAVAARQRAEVEQERAERVSTFLKELFRSADPDAPRGGELTVRQVLDQGRTRLAEGLEGEPALEAELAGTLGDVYRNLGIYEEAVPLLRRAVELRRQLFPTGDLRLAVALNDLGSALYYLERYAEAEACLRESLAMRRRLGAEPSAIAQALNNLASVKLQQGELAAAGELYEEALQIRQVVHGLDSAEVASSLYSLGALRFAAGDLEKSEPLLRRALETYVAVYGEKHTRVASVLTQLGRVLHARGALTEAETVLRRALAVRTELLGEESAQATATREALEAVEAAAGLQQPRDSTLR